MTDFATVAQAADIPPGQARVIDIDGRSIALCHTTGGDGSDGTFYAIDNICTHDSGPLGEGDLLGNCIECPRHGALFDVTTGKATTLPAIGRVAAHAVRVVDGSVQVALSPARNTAI